MELKSAPRGMGGSQKATLQPLYVLMLCVGVVLLIACANVAGLLLARSTRGRKKLPCGWPWEPSAAESLLQLLTESFCFPGRAACWDF